MAARCALLPLPMCQGVPPGNKGKGKEGRKDGKGREGKGREIHHEENMSALHGDA